MKNKSFCYFSRILVLCCAAIIACNCVTGLQAFADEKSYRTDSADFDITLSENGDATITERWTVTYTSGSFTRFYKDIFDPGNQLEYFPEINVISCHINDTEATPTYSIDRIDYHYFFERSDSQMYTIHWFKAAQNETINYDITYQIPNAVKINEYNDAEYCYRLIGYNFPSTVGEVNTNIHLPDIDAVNQATLSSGAFENDGNVLHCKEYNVNGVYKVRLNMKSDCFGTLQHIASVEVPQGYSENETTSYSSGSLYTSSKSSLAPLIIPFVFMLMPVILLVGALVTSIVYRFKAKKMLKDDPNCFIDAAEYIERSRIPYVWYGLKDVGIQADTQYMFYSELIDLCNKGYLTFTKQGFHFNQIDDRGTWDSVQRDMDQSFLSLLIIHFPIEEAMNSRMISFSKMKDYNANDTTLYHDFSKWVSDYNKAINNSPMFIQLKQNGQLNELKPNFKKWKDYARYVNLKLSVSDCFSLLERTGTINTYTILQMMQGFKYVTKSSDQNDFDSYYFIHYFNHTYSSNINSGRSSGGGCSGCSSCSSCSGCGGGGAD